MVGVGAARAVSYFARGVTLGSAGTAKKIRSKDERLTDRRAKRESSPESGSSHGEDPGDADTER